MTIFINILLVLLVFCFLTGIKNVYTAKMLHKTSKLISNYCLSLIAKGSYDVEFDYYDEMMVTYYKYLFNPFAFGKYKGIKPRYRKLLKDFDSSKDLSE